MEFFTQLTHWHWIVLALILISAEALGIGGFLLGAAAAALIAAIFAWCEAAWQTQLIVFGVLAAAFSVMYWKYFKTFNLRQDKETRINQKLEAMRGKTGVVVQLISKHRGKIKIGDTLWECESQNAIAESQTVEVVGYKDMTLLVEAQH